VGVEGGVPASQNRWELADSTMQVPCWSGDISPKLGRLLLEKHRSEIGDERLSLAS